MLLWVCILMGSLEACSHLLSSMLQVTAWALQALARQTYVRLEASIQSMSDESLRVKMARSMNVRW